MYIESVPNRNSPPAVLLRESYRDEKGKVKKRTIANLTSLKPEVIASLKVLLKGGNASELPLADQFVVERTLPHGHVAAVCGLFGQLGMFALLERKASQERSLAAALIVSRLLDPGSKLAAARQINFGLLCSQEGCPVAVEVFPGNTADPSTVQAQVDKLRERFGMEKILLVGDRGMLTGARMEALRQCEDISWISALQNTAVRKLADSGAVQMDLFDKRDLAEISCPEEFPGERLVVSKRTEEGLCVHSFHSLLAELSTLCRVTLRPKIDKAPSFRKLSKQTPLQEKVFQLLGLQPKIVPCSQRVTDAELISRW